MSQNLPAVEGVESKKESATGNENETPTPQGKLILDATVAEQAIRYPTDLNLLNEGGNSMDRSSTFCMRRAR